MNTDTVGTIENQSNVPFCMEIAKVAHEINRAYCAAIGDNSQAAWEDAELWQRASCIASVEAHMKTDMTPEQAHEAWLAHKRADDWKYGPVKSLILKEHPCFVPYSELPVEQRVRDHLFRAVVQQLGKRPPA